MWSITVSVRETATIGGRFCGQNGISHSVDDALLLLPQMQGQLGIALRFDAGGGGGRGFCAGTGFGGSGFLVGFECAPAAALSRRCFSKLFFLRACFFSFAHISWQSCLRSITKGSHWSFAR